MNSKNKNIGKYFSIGLIFIFIVLSVSFFRSLFIHNFVEVLMKRQLRDFSKWDNILQHSIFLVVFGLVIIHFLSFLSLGQSIWNSIKEKILSIFHEKNAKINFLFLIILFAVAFFALIHANYDYADDMRRSYTGERSWIGSSRYISEFLSIFIHTNIYINDITPITQIWAILFITLASYFTAFALTDGCVSVKVLIPASFMGLSPFFIANLAYKYDCPYMALAVLLGVFPFLFVDNKKAYIFTSFVCLIGACISYQAATSIYIVFAAYFAFRYFIQRKNISDILKYVSISIICFAVSLVFFKLFFMNSKSDIGMAAEFGLAKKGYILSSILINLKNYLTNVIFYFGNIWIKIFTIIVFFLFVIISTKESKQNKIITIIVSVLFLTFVIVFSYGAYLILEYALVETRMFMGFSAIISCISVFVVFESSLSLKKLSFACILLLGYAFVVFDATFGNVMVKQHAYENFAITVLLEDLNHIVDKNSKNTFYIEGMPAWGGNTNQTRKNYKIAHIYPELSHFLLNDYSMYFNFESVVRFSSLPIERQKELREMPLVVDSYYHQIRSDGNGTYYITYNTPLEY